MDKLTRNILGQTVFATLEKKTTTGRVLAIAKIGDKEQVCFQTTDGKNGIWIPSFALVDREKWIRITNGINKGKTKNFNNFSNEKNRDRK